MLGRFGYHKWLKGLLLVVITTVMAISSGCSASLSQPVSDGVVIFQEKCAGCHTIGAGDLVGPDLKSVTQQRDPHWLAGFISEPDKVLASGDPIATSLRKQYGNLAMPNLGLTQAQVAAIITYLNSQAEAASSSQPVAAKSLPAGDVARGKSLFMGDVHLTNGGPPCMGCHNIGSNGLLGGGALGPDLTKVATRYSDVGLAAALGNIPWPTMQPIFSEHPLTLQEQADLLAFMKAAADQRATNKEGLVMAISLAGFIAVVVLIAIVYRRRLRGIRRPLVERTLSGK
jgi:mono/diheme cytochrome c family protein